jgi:hypothetical protein
MLREGSPEMQSSKDEALKLHDDFDTSGLHKDMSESVMQFVNTYGIKV